MATRTTRSQTHALGTELPPSPRDNPLSVFGSNRQVSEVVEQFQSFSAPQTAPSASSVRFPTESPTPGAHIIIPDNDQSDASSHLFGSAVVYNHPGHPKIPRGDPPGSPSSDDDSDFPGHNLTPDDDSGLNNCLNPSRHAFYPFLTLLHRNLPPLYYHSIP